MLFILSVNTFLFLFNSTTKKSMSASIKKITWWKSKLHVEQLHTCCKKYMDSLSFVQKPNLFTFTDVKLYNWNYAIVQQASLYSALWCPQWIALVDCTTKHKARAPPINIMLWLGTQFYIQLLYRPHFGTWLLPFGL